MAANLGGDDTSTAEMVVLRTEDGAWYELPIADLEWTRITDPAQLEELRNQLAAEGGAAPAADAIDALPVALLSPEALATYRVDAERAAALEQHAAAVAGKDDAVGFTHGGVHDIGAGFFIIGDREWHVYKNTISGWGATQTLVLAPPPSVRFPGSFPGVA